MLKNKTDPAPRLTASCVDRGVLCREGAAQLSWDRGGATPALRDCWPRTHNLAWDTSPGRRQAVSTTCYVSRESTWIHPSFQTTC